ncbi:hypothetical protein LCGC14_1086610, partial [marine sediment metagenome]
ELTDLLAVTRRRYLEVEKISLDMEEKRIDAEIRGETHIPDVLKEGYVSEETVERAKSDMEAVKARRAVLRGLSEPTEAPVGEAAPSPPQPPAGPPGRPTRAEAGPGRPTVGVEPPAGPEVPAAGEAPARLERDQRVDDLETELEPVAAEFRMVSQTIRDHESGKNRLQPAQLKNLQEQAAGFKTQIENRVTEVEQELFQDPEGATYRRMADLDDLTARLLAPVERAPLPTGPAPEREPRVWTSRAEVPEGVETKRLAGGRRQEILPEEPKAPTAEKPAAKVTPQVPTEPGQKHVLPSFAGKPYGTPEAAEPAAVAPPDDWRPHLAKARVYAKDLGIEEQVGTENWSDLDQIVAAIDAHLAGQAGAAPDALPAAEVVGKPTAADVTGAIEDIADNILPEDIFLSRVRFIASNKPAEATATAEAIDQVTGLRERLTSALRDVFGDRIRVYRAGDISSGPQAWTTNLEIARSFSRLSGGERDITQGIVTPGDVLFPGAAVDGELVVNSSSVQDVRPVEASPEAAPVAPTEPAPQISGEEGPSETEALRPTTPREPGAKPTGAAPRPAPEGEAAQAPRRSPARRPGDEGPGAEGPPGEAPVQPGGVEEGEAGVGGVARPDRGGVGAERPGAGRRPGGKQGRGAAVPGNYRVRNPDDLKADRPLKQKAKDNLTAIRLLKEIEGAGRPATREEQEILAQYAGWGFAKTVFEPYRKSDFQEIGRELEGLLTTEEWDSARRSSVNAHFTDPGVVIKMWEALEHMGFTGGRLLEPGMGAGYFWSLIPEALRGSTRLSGVELDLLTGRIAKLLFPKADVRVQGFEEFQIPDGYYRAAMSNVPFGEYRPFDPKYQKHRFTIHNYFFAKTLDKVEPGGVVAFITSRYTMDGKKALQIRKYLAERADLLGAIRLPRTAFKKVANTDVTTDIIFLRKRHPGEPAGGESWVDLGEITLPIPKKELYSGAPTEETVSLNQYYIKYPEMMLGKMGLTGTQYRANEPTLEPKEGSLVDQLAEAIQALPRDVLVPFEVTPTDVEIPHSIQAPETVKEGAFFIENGKLMRRLGGQAVPARTPPTAKALQGKAYTGQTLQRIKGLIGIRDAARAVLVAQFTDEPDAEIHNRQAVLTKLYGRFHRRFGPINKKSGARQLNLEGFRSDPDLQLVANLENIALVNEEEVYSKADLFTKRVLSPPKPIQHAEKPEDALLAVLNERGRVELGRMAEISNFTEEDLIESLRGRIFENPQTNEWEAAELYLAGNVRAKLAAAQGAAQEDPRYQHNVKALEAVQPADLPPTKIQASLGAPWIPPSDIEQFIADLLNRGQVSGIHVAYSEPIATWHVRVDTNLRNRPKSRREWGTERRPMPDLVAAALNQTEVKVVDRAEDGSRIPNPTQTVAAQAKLEDLKKRFAEWLWEDPERATRLHRVYNDGYNNTVPYRPDGSHMTFPGMADVVNGEPFQFRPHQPNAIWRILQTGNTLLAHAVGSGKTFVMAAAGMEAKRIGLATKPMYVVPNRILGQFGREFLQLYPTARVLVATKKDLQKENRKGFIAKVAANEWDAVVIAQSSFTFIPVSPAFEARFIEAQLAEIEEALFAAEAELAEESSRAARSMVRTIEVAKNKLETRLLELENRDRKDDVLSFEEMGIDMLFVDESHRYKNLYAPSKLRSLGGSKPVQKALDMYMKVSYLNERTPGRGVVFATGTPLSRSIVEMYTLLRYLAPQELANRGMRRLDAWASGFAETSTKIELRPEGGFRNYTRLSPFKNAPELSQLFQTVTDVQTAAMLDLPKPKIRGGQPEAVVAPMSPELEREMQDIVHRAQAIRGGQVDPHDDNMLKLSHDGDMAALDVRLIDPSYPDYPDSKVNTATDRIFSIWEKTKKNKSTQLVFIDWSTPKDDFNIYDDIKGKLIARGIPAREIAFIHDAKTDLAISELFARVRAGSVRLLFGSTEKMGEGVNVQARVIALHHLDAPWNPSHIDQRNGRGERQGNLNPEIEILIYTTEGSFDAYRWQTLKRKAQFIDQIVRAEVTSRTIEDVDGREFTYAEIMAITTGNPMVLEKAQIDNDVLRLSQLSRQHTDRQFAMRRDLATIGEQRPYQEETRDAATADKKQIVDTSGKKFTITLQGRTYAKRPEAGKALMGIVAKVAKGAQSKQIGNFAGFALEVRESLGSVHFAIRGRGYYETTVQFSSTNTGAIQSVEYLPNRIEANRDWAVKSLAELAERDTELQELIGKSFDQQEQLDKLLVRQQEIDQALDLDRPPPDEILDDRPDAPAE